MPTPTLPASLIKPTRDTQFYIDLNWWAQSGQDLRMVLMQLCEEFGDAEAAVDVEREVDWIDPQTGEVQRVDGLMYTVLSRCSQHSDFITSRTALIEAVFRALLAGGNRPMTPVELAERTGRSADMILRTLSGRVIYKGIRPYTGER